MKLRLFDFVKYLFRNWDFVELYCLASFCLIVIGQAINIITLVTVYHSNKIGLLMFAAGIIMIIIGGLKVVIVNPLRQSYRNFQKHYNEQQEKLLEQIRTGKQ